MTCEYPGCGNDAAFVCVARFEDTEETKRVCEAHKKTAEHVGLMLDFDVTVTPIPDDN